MIGATQRERGFALVIVLWTMALLAVIGFALLDAGRKRTASILLLGQATQLEAAADGAIQKAIFDLLEDSAAHWAADGATRVVNVAGVAVSVRVEDEAVKLNPNIGPPGPLSALLVQAGLDRRAAADLSAAIIAWRTPGGGASAAESLTERTNRATANAPFRRLDELGLVPGMTPDLVQQLRPYMTLFTDDDTNSPVPGDQYAPGTPSVCRITVTARGRQEVTFSKRVVVRFNARRIGLRYEILASEPLSAAE